MRYLGPVREFLGKYFEWILAALFFVILWRWAGYLVPHNRIDTFDEFAAISTAIGRDNYSLAPGYTVWLRLLSFVSGSTDIVYLNDLNTQILLALIPGVLFTYLLSIKADIISIFLSVFTTTIVFAGMMPGNKNIQFVFLLLLVAFTVSARLGGIRERVPVLIALATAIFVRSEYVLSLGICAVMAGGAWYRKCSIPVRKWIPASIGIVCLVFGASVLSRSEQTSNSAGVFILANEIHHRDLIRQTVPQWVESRMLDEIPDFSAIYGHPSSLLEAIWNRPDLFLRHLAQGLSDIPFRTYEDFLMNAVWVSPVRGFYIIGFFYLLLVGAVLYSRRVGSEPWVSTQLNRGLLFEHFALLAVPACAVCFIYFATFRYLLPIVMILPAVLFGSLLAVDLRPAIKRGVLSLMVFSFLIPPQPTLFRGLYEGEPIHEIVELARAFPRVQGMRVLALQHFRYLLPFTVRGQLIGRELKAFLADKPDTWINEFDLICDGFSLEDFLRDLGPTYPRLLESLRQDPEKHGFVRHALKSRASISLFLRKGQPPQSQP